jgi:hypothetical protein
MDNCQHRSFFGVWQRVVSLQEFDAQMMGRSTDIVVTQSAITQTGGRMIGVEVGGMSGTINIVVSVP